MGIAIIKLGIQCITYITAVEKLTHLRYVKKPLQKPSVNKRIMVGTQPCKVKHCPSRIAAVKRFSKEHEPYYSII